MNRWARVGVLSAAGALAGANVGGCVTGDIPPQQTSMPDGGSGSPGSGSGGQGAGPGDEGGSGGSSGSSGASSGSGGASSSSDGASSGFGGTSSGSGGSSGSSGGGGNSTSDGGGASGTGGSGAADAGAANGCVKAMDLWYVVRKDGHVLAESRDQTMQKTILGADANPMTNATAVTGGVSHGCALLGDATVWCWRERADSGNRFGQLGAGTTDTDATAPVERASQVLIAPGQPLTNVQALTKGGTNQYQTCAITGAGNLYCWGDLTWIANGGTALVSPYAQAITTDGFAAMTGIVQAAICPTMACAVVKGSPNNSLYCWGANSDSNLGTGDTNNRRYPTKVTTLTSPTQVSVYAYSYLGNIGGTTCAIDGDQLLCWGLNNGNLTGTGKTDATINTPTPVVKTDGTGPLPKPIDISSGPGGTFCTLEPNQTIWCWGSGFSATAANYGLTNVSILGGLFPLNSFTTTPLLLTSDGTYHWGMEWSRSPDCSP